MEEIANNIFIESIYPGVVLGVLKLEQGVLMVDAPFRVEDQLSWQVKMDNLGGSEDRLLVMLDTHIDRTLGIRAMESNVLGHENAIEIIRNRSTTARGQDVDAGADWEPYDLPLSIRWALPDMSYTDKVSVYWDDSPVVISHHPGAHLAGSWLQYDAEKIVFVGDSVVLNQPPFLAWSDIDIWLEELAWLKSDAFKGYKIVSGRNGLVKPKSFDKLISFLTQCQEITKDLSLSDNLVSEIISVVPSLLKKFKVEPEMKELFENRLIWGLKQYIQRHKSENDQNL